jgi:hypothetical protein
LRALVFKIFENFNFVFQKNINLFHEAGVSGIEESSARPLPIAMGCQPQIPAPADKRRGNLIKPQLFSNFPTHVFFLFSHILG